MDILNDPMTLFGGVLTVLLLGYLFFALLFPERLS